jgi:hypothetical protein
VVGQDSFLDIVANLVGILIILVMVVGARAKDAMAVAGTKPVSQSDPIGPLASEVAAARAAADQVQADFQRIEEQLRRQEIEVVYRQEERNRVQLLVVTAERQIAAHRQQLDETQRQQFDRQSEILAAQAELNELDRGIGHLEHARPETQIIHHLPTPMAKTVFGKEVHLRLHNGRVACVPWDEFVVRLKEDAPQKAGRLREQPEVTETVGPIRGFWMRYTLKRESHVLPGKVGVAVQQTASLDRFVLLPESESMGELLADALRPGSQLDALLAAHRPASTTITVWTYPDSFSEFRQLKQALYERGFVSAARPLPPNHPIGGSPEGSRSSAQ